MRCRAPRLSGDQGNPSVHSWMTFARLGVQGDLGFKVPGWVTTQEPVATGLWLPSALQGAH